MKRTNRIVMRMALATALVAAAVVGSAGAAAAGADASTVAASRRVVVGLESGAATRGLASARAKGGTVERTGGKGRFAVVKVPRGMTAEQFSAQLKNTAGVRYVAPQRVVTALLTPDDPYFGDQWGMSAINAPTAWDLERGDPSVKIAIIDTGVDLENPDLAAHVDTANDYDFVNNDYTAQDDESHGTHVAGTAAAITDNGIDVAGVANGCTILPIKVLDYQGYGFDSDVADGIVWAADHGADVISMSLGGPDPSPVLTDAVNYAFGKDCIVVAASGNENTAVSYPAADDGVIAVGATTSSNTRSNFSNYGPELDIAAPGSNITSNLLGGGVATWNGTSMATPHVAGAAALLKSHFPSWTHTQIEERLLATAQDLGPAGRDDYFGAGLLDLYAALDGSGGSHALDDEIPGVPVPSSPVVGSLDATSDVNDVYAINLAAEQTLTVTLTTAPGTDFDLKLFGPGAKSVTDTALASDPASLSFLVPASGTYYLDVAAASGAGSYTLTWSKTMLPTSISLSGPSVCGWGSVAWVTGTLRQTGGPGLAGQTVTIDEKPYGSAEWMPVRYVKTGASGSFVADVYPAKMTQYRARFWQTEDRYGATSTSWTIRPYASLTRPSVPASVVRNVTFTTGGTVAPSAPTGSRTVKISAYRYEGGTWVLRRHVYATNTAYSTYAKYSARLLLPYAGSWKLVSSVGGNTTYAPTASAPRYVTVK